MPKVDLIATKDFGYNTRRLKAQEPFQARNATDALILTKVRKVAEVAKPKAKKAAPVEEVAEEAPKAKPGARARKAKAKK